MNEAKLLEAIKTTVQEAFKGLDPKFESIEAKFGSLDKKLDTKIDSLDKKFDTKFNSLEFKFGALDGKFGSLENKFGTLDGKFGSLENKFGTLEGKFGSLENQFGYLRADIIDLKDKVNAAFDASSRLPEIAGKVENHENRIEVLEQKAIAFTTAIQNRPK